MQTSKLVLPFVEMMATQVCNLRCYGCSNYSELWNKDYLAWDQAKAQIEPWLEIFDLPDFGIIGGEPLINPTIDKWILGIRDLLPQSQIRFTTNGLLLSKNPDLFDLLDSIGNCVFKITVHVQDPSIEDYIRSILSLPGWNEVIEFGVHRWKRDSGLKLQINRPQSFLKTFRGSYLDMLPHDNDPVQAFKACIQKTCPLLYQGRIYKCSTAGLLKDTLSKLGNPNIDVWTPYIDSGISPDSTYEEISGFVDNFGLPHQRCQQCPTKHDTTIDHTAMIFTRRQSAEMISNISV